MGEIQSRISHNLGRYSSNYSVIFALLAIYALIRNPLLLFVIALAVLGMLGIGKLAGENLAIGWVVRQEQMTLSNTKQTDQLDYVSALHDSGLYLCSAWIHSITNLYSLLACWRQRLRHSRTCSTYGATSRGKTSQSCLSRKLIHPSPNSKKFSNRSKCRHAKAWLEQKHKSSFSARFSTLGVVLTT